MARAHRGIWLVSACAAAVAATTASAQTNVPTEREITPAAGDVATADESDDIVVTANRRSQALTDVGIAISVLDNNQLETRQVSSVSDLAALVPGLSVGNSGYATPIYSLRGVGVNEPTVGAGSSVTVYVDEIPLTLPIFTRGATFDLERVEVVTPVHDPEHRQRLSDILDETLYHPDTWLLRPDGTYSREGQLIGHVPEDDAA